MNTEQLRAFMQVAREGRLTVAAKQLGVSQSGLSRQLQALEARVARGHRLTKLKRAVALTEVVEEPLRRSGP